MRSHNKNSLKQLSFHEQEIKPKKKKFTNAKLLSESPFLCKTYES